MARRKYSAIDILSRHESGRAIEEVDDYLARVVRAVIKNGGKGSVTLRINVSPNGSAVNIAPEIKMSAPTRAATSAFYYPDEETGDLFREPPEDEADRMLKSISGGKGDQT